MAGKNRVPGEEDRKEKFVSGWEEIRIVQEGFL